LLGLELAFLYNHLIAQFVLSEFLGVICVMLL